MTQSIFESPIDRRAGVDVVPERYRSGISVYVSGVVLAVPLSCFTGALMADIAYVKSADIQWSNFASWLLAFGMVFLGVLIVYGVVGFLLRLGKSTRGAGPAFGIFILAATIVGMFDNFIHTHDGWTSVWPVGLSLSIATVALLVLALMAKLASLFRTFV